MQTKQLKIEKKFKGIQELLNEKQVNIRMLYDFLTEIEYKGFKSYDMLWWVATGVRQPRDTVFYILVARYLNVKTEQILLCYTKQEKLISSL